ncbi:MAG: TRAP transporter large permease, partial [Betaproteobacteria bacterium]
MIGVSLLWLIGILAIGIPVGASLVMLGLVLAGIYSPFPLVKAIGETSWGASSDVIVVSVPMFILMGELMLRSGVAELMYDAMVKWFSWLPGGLMHSNIGACAMFAATSGSSAATAATISTVSLPEMKKHGYNASLYTGSLAAGGTLGILIPPSINMVVYGVLTNTSIPQLYLAGFIPGFLLAAFFMLTILIACLVKPAWGGRKIVVSWEERFSSLPNLIPPFGLFLIVIGSIYAGWATPTEAASLGVVATFALAAFNGRLNMKVLRLAFEGTMRSTAMIMLIFVGAFFLNFVLSAVGLSREITNLITGLKMSPLETMIAIVIFYVTLGCFMETMAMMITTVPIVVPIITAMGYDPVWFGIIIIILVEVAMITPPVGVNLYIVQGVRREGSLYEVIIGALPFVITMMVMIAILIAFPNLAMWLPNM